MNPVNEELTRRHGDDPSIPVLTERMDESELHFAVDAVAEPAVAASESVVTEVQPPLHAEVVHAVTARLAAEYAVVLGEQLRMQLQPAIDAAAAQLAHQTVASLHDTLPERIDQALAELQRKPDAPQTPVL